MRKKNCILELYHKAPPNSAVLCFDEWGPLELRPQHGQHWAPKGHPQRFRATYTRRTGTEQFLGFYDVHRDCLAGTIHKRKTVRDLLTAFKRLRQVYPRRIKLCVVMDNLPYHKAEALRIFFTKNNIKPVWTPTYSSWLNLIEAHFGAMKRSTLNVSDDLDHLIQRKRIYRYLRWRNRNVGSHSCKLNKMFNH